MLDGENRQRELVRYAIAIVAVAVAALAWSGARLVLIVDVLGATAVALFGTATLVSAWIAGTGPGIAATAAGAVVLLFLASGPQHRLAHLSPRDIGIVVASTVLSALITIVVERLRASHSALLRGLPEIERRARDRANDAAARSIEEERRKTAAAKEDVSEMQRKLQQWKSAASTASNARADYVATTKLAVRLPLRALEHYTHPASGDTLQQRDAAAIARCEAHLATLLDTVLVPGRLESGQLVPSRADVSLSEVVPQALALAEPLLAARGSSVECGNLDVPPVRGDAAILVQVLARLLVDEASARPGAFQLEAKLSDNVVTLECLRSADGRLTMAPPVASSANSERKETESLVWSSLATAERLAQMGGAIATGAGPGAASRFTISLPIRPATDVQETSLPVMLWPPIAFEYPRPTPGN